MKLEVYSLIVNRKRPKTGGNEDSINEIVSLLDHGTVKKDLHVKIIYYFPDKSMQVKVTDLTVGRQSGNSYAIWICLLVKPLGKM